jgi:hypothetical protein
MKRAPFAAILTLLLATAPVLPAIAADGGPLAAIAEPVLDKGEVPVGETIEAVFEIANQGDQPLEITEVRPSCGCTVAEFDEVIQPGGTGKVTARVDTTSIIGPNAKSVTVFTNDPENPRIQLTVKSEVKPFLGMNPGYARFTSFVHEDRDQTSTQLLAAPGFRGLEILGVDSPQPFIQVSYREARDAERDETMPGKQWRIDVTLSKEAPVGPVADHVLIHTNHPKQKRIEIPVSGFVRPMVAVTPPAVNFGKVDTSEAQQWGILVRNFGSTPLEIQDVASSVSGLDVEVESIEEGQQYKLVFTPTAAMTKGPFHGSVELKTNLPQQPMVTVKLTGEVL